MYTYTLSDTLSDGILVLCIVWVAGSCLHSTSSEALGVYLTSWLVGAIFPHVSIFSTDAVAPLVLARALRHCKRGGVPGQGRIHIMSCDIIHDAADGVTLHSLYLYEYCATHIWYTLRSPTVPWMKVESQRTRKGSRFVVDHTSPANVGPMICMSRGSQDAARE